MQKNKVLIIGSGGREHALGWKLSQSAQVEKIYFAPGNAGTAQIGENVDIGALDIEGLVKFASENKIDLTVVGPDDCLAKGVVDVFQERGLMIFGPTKMASQLEWSKAFSKDLMREVGVPTASYETFRDFEEAKEYVGRLGLPVVIKASGLALGKGVIIAKTLEEAEEALENIMVKKVFGEAGAEVVVEEFLYGGEVSVHVFSDGKTVSMFPAARDHKAIFEGNRGPNTGGMGTIAPLEKFGEEKIEEVKERLVLPVIDGMRSKGSPYRGILYPGIMVTGEGEKVLEFNSRFGDPETQSYMRILKTDLFEIMMACCTGSLDKVKVEWEEKYACCIVLASEGYPGSYKKGEVIEGLEEVEKGGVVVFHAGTRLEDGKVLTNGGRVLGVTAVGETLQEALEKAYGVIGEGGIWFKGMQYRSDIGRVKN